MEKSVVVNPVDKSKSIDKANNNLKKKVVAEKEMTFKTSAGTPSDECNVNSSFNLSFNDSMKRLGLSNYTWSAANSDNIVEKSQNNFIDMIRYYEGDKDNYYEASENSKDNYGISSCGFGLRRLSMYSIGKAKKVQDKYVITNPPKNKKETYEQLLMYLEKVSKKEVCSYLGEGLYNSLPQSVKAALLDYHFKNGFQILRNSGLKEVLQDSIKTNKWSKVLEKLVYAKSASKSEDGDVPGIYRRSLSRVIFAAKGLKNLPGVNKADIDATVKKVYDGAIACAKSKQINTKEFERIYNTYKGVVQTKGNNVTKSKKDMTYVIPHEMSIYSLAMKLRPKLDQYAGVNPTVVTKEIADKIIKINNIKVYGYDANGYPKADSIKPGVSLKLPNYIDMNVAGKKTDIELIKPKDFKVLDEKAQKKVANKNNQTKNKEVVKNKNNEEGNFTKFAKKFGTTALKFASYTPIGMRVSLTVKTMKFVKDKLKQFVEYVSNKDKKSSKKKVLNRTPIEKLYSSYDPKIKKVENTNLEIMNFEYPIKKGDTLYRIGKNFGIDLKTIQEQNEISDMNNIQVGQKLKLNKIAYKIQKGDNLGKIAQKYGLNVEILEDLNNFNSKSKIFIGEYIEIPAYTYVAKNGDNLYQIAKKAGVSLQKLKEINGLSSDNLSIGKELVILFNNVDYNRETKVNKDNKGNVIEDVNMSDNIELKNRELLKTKRKINGKVVATRKVFEPTNKKGPLKGKTIIVNAGHGYKASGMIDRGTPGVAGMESEWLLNYDNAMQLKNKLCAQGAKVIFLQGKKSLVVNEFDKKENKADLFISVHTNSGPANAKDRTQIYYYDKTKNAKARMKSIKLANVIETKLDSWISKNEKINSKDKFIVNNGVQDYAQVAVNDERTGILKESMAKQNIPSVLWEVAFMSSPKGRERLSSPKLISNYANELTKAVVEYYKK